MSFLNGWPHPPQEFHIMNTNRRIVLATAGATLATPHLADATFAQGTGETSKLVRALLDKSERSNMALMRGDIAAYRLIVTYSEDFTLMSPFGGEPTQGRDMTQDKWDAMGRFFKNGTFKQEIVQTYGSKDMVVLALIEHCTVEVGGLPMQEWQLRVTLVYRRNGADWHLVHRHADPLVAGISREKAAALARGES
jgi:ketosteroid isomerase-like protein